MHRLGHTSCFSLLAVFAGERPQCSHLVIACVFHSEQGLVRPSCTEGFVTWPLWLADVSEKKSLLFRVSIPACHHHSIVSLTPLTIRFCLQVNRKEKKKRYVLTRVPPGRQTMCHCQEKFAAVNASTDSHVPTSLPHWVLRSVRLQRSPEE